ncbi:hypothetical protein QU232_004196 [Vibrio vulnificus]|nr:hypothetical protein [Vibrio vulnificus]EIU7824538.1 hypothetical protein [Vibrio vulnificus]ELP1869977.1 hypothetical protein [Vibrio vulnificus]HAS8565451.1 hypothetical protein [Vibrio vulnificus]
MQNCTCLFASKLSGTEQLQALLDIMLNSRHRTEQRALKKPAELALFFCLAQKDGQSRVRGRIKTQTTCFHAGTFITFYDSPLAVRLLLPVPVNP